MKSLPYIYLLNLTGNPTQPVWSNGEVHDCKRNIAAINQILQTIHQETPDGYVLFWGLNQAPPDEESLLQTLNSPGDVWHAGLKLGQQGKPAVIHHFQPNWMLNKDPNSDTSATSWRISFNACLIRISVLKHFGYIPTGYRSLASAALDLGFRMIQKGVIVRHTPFFQIQIPPLDFKKLPSADEAFFARRNFSRFWNVWITMRVLLTGSVPRIPYLFHSCLKLFQPTILPSELIYKGTFIQANDSSPKTTSIIIPTLNRYSSLATLLGELCHLNPQPLEIIIIDQSDLAKRNPDFYLNYTTLPLRVIYQEVAGQCSSRNAGIQTAKGDYLLFLDDDIENVPTDFINLHLNTLTNNNAEVSSGIAPEPGSHLPANFKFKRHSDVFPLGNSLFKKSLLKATGLLDLAYNRGARADHDLGMRIYLSGAVMILNPDISVVHNHAPQGGLREHKARLITRTHSRQNLTHRRIPSVTEFYLLFRYFTNQQVREYIYIMILGSFSIQGSPFRKILKLMIGLYYLPNTLYLTFKQAKKAKGMLNNFPQIPKVTQNND